MCDMMSYTCGDKREAVSVMREAAQWLIDMGKPLWRLEELTEERLTATPEEFHVGWQKGKSAAAMILSFEDAFFWPDVPAGTSGFVHKLSVRREFAGMGCAQAMLEHARDVCRGRGMEYLRLDCDAGRDKLRGFYEQCGFALAERKTLHTKHLSVIDLALYQLKL